ncbi:hypothetical protein PC129_g4197 [Phytophthora cactorum]|uniref:Uncharacterized protein n=1 Tax=Phytophthora cactorum TaxID=29920 RepID=A0A8T1L8X7_9STRA|nr:hypothetical protein PC117_g5738 [Phytophthora cactorum]KAG3225157.1 hypothetical protein PC129_g4197 [Phytophthora cactorum]KAG4243685.1 hypothetical protein PC116_g8449 [Phytophthora cactorum]
MVSLGPNYVLEKEDVWPIYSCDDRMPMNRYEEDYH